MRPEIELVEGRLFSPGLREVIVGRNAQRAFAGLEIGDRVALRDSEWTVVGVYRSGDVAESGMITDAATLLSAYQRAVVNSVTVRLESPESFDAFKTALTTNPSLSVDVFREPEYFAQQTEDLSSLFFFITYIVTGIMGAGALVGAINTMYSAVSARSLEIATLRAIGFGASGVVVSVLAEAVLLALVGACRGRGDLVAAVQRRHDQSRRGTGFARDGAHDHARDARDRSGRGRGRGLPRRPVPRPSRGAVAGRHGAARDLSEQRSCSATTRIMQPFDRWDAS